MTRTTRAPVLLDVDGPIARITFNRPEKLNAADLAQCHALEAAVQAVAGEPDVRVVVLTGTGRSFGTGIDRDMLATEGMPPRRLIFSAQTIGPDEALRLGLVDHLVPAERFDTGVEELVTRYAAVSPIAMAAAKRLTARAMDAPLDTVYAEALPLLAACLDSPEFAATSAVWHQRTRSTPS